MKFSIGGRGMDQIQQLADYIDHSNSIVAITGAGISVAGGGMTLILVIGTQRNYGGVYWNYRRRDAAVVQINPGHTGFVCVRNRWLMNAAQKCYNMT